jgi:hypothetical protein
LAPFDGRFAPHAGPERATDVGAEALYGVIVGCVCLVIRIINSIIHLWLRPDPLLEEPDDGKDAKSDEKTHSNCNTGDLPWRDSTRNLSRRR